MNRKPLGFLVFALTGLVSQSIGLAQEYEWIHVTDEAAYAPRDGAGALVFKNRMWLIGGWNPSDKENFPRICNNRSVEFAGRRRLDSGEAQYVSRPQF